MSKNPFEEWTQKFQELMPDRMKELSDEVRHNMASFMQSSFQKMDLVTREEFDVQQKVLAKTRELVEQLETRVTELEQKVFGKVQTQAPIMSTDTKSEEN